MATPEDMSWSLSLVAWHDATVELRTLLGKVEKRMAVVAASYSDNDQSQKRWVRKLRPVVQHTVDRWVRSWKVNVCFTLLKRITKLKNVKSEIKSEDQNSYLERYSPKGSWHLDESSMNHTLAQNCHCESCCGAHLTCKNQPFKPDRSRSLKGPGKQWKLPSP